MNTFGKIFVAIALIFAGTGLAKAQFSNPDSGGSFTLNFIGSMPVGDFSKATTSYPSMLLLGENNGNAVMGAGLGFKAGYQFGFGLGVFLSADAVWNQLNKDMRSRYDDISKTKPNYINFPLFLNLDYKCYFGNVFGLYAEAGAGANLLYITPEGWSDDMTNFKLSAAFAWEAGGGVLLGEHISIGAHYYMLGDHMIENVKTITPAFLQLTRKQNVGILTFKLGLIF